MKSQSKIIILRGNSGSGKTTVAKELQKKLGQGTLLISQDVIRREMLWVNDGLGTKASSLLSNLIMYGRDNCDFVILEGILNTKWYGELFEGIRNEYTSIYAYYFDLPFDETLTRHQSRPQSSEFGEAEMKRWWNEKDYIDIIQEKTLTKEQSLNSTVTMIYNDVMSS